MIYVLIGMYLFVTVTLIRVFNQFKDKAEPPMWPIVMGFCWPLLFGAYLMGFIEEVS